MSRLGKLFFEHATIVECAIFLRLEGPGILVHSIQWFDHCPHTFIVSYSIVLDNYISRISSLYPPPFVFQHHGITIMSALTIKCIVR